MEDTPPKAVIRVMADFGNGPWAWGPDGKNIADATGWGPEGYLVSDQLKKDFADWVTEFERNRDLFDTPEQRAAIYEPLCLPAAEIAEEVEESKKRPLFDWRSFHARGLSLSKRLFEELGGKVTVIYEKPGEDPNHSVDGRTLFS